VNSKKPTGDPNCPPHIRRAKLIQKSIIAKSDSGGGSLNNDDLGIVDDDKENDPQNLLPALENTTTTLAAALENSTTTLGYKWKCNSNPEVYGYSSQAQ
jgi:hypothetical protein